jgi:hypothetical protein
MPVAPGVGLSAAHIMKGCRGRQRSAHPQHLRRARECAALRWLQSTPGQAAEAAAAQLPGRKFAKCRRCMQYRWIHGRLSQRGIAGRLHVGLGAAAPRPSQQNEGRRQPFRWPGARRRRRRLRAGRQPPAAVRARARRGRRNYGAAASASVAAVPPITASPPWPPSPRAWRRRRHRRHPRPQRRPGARRGRCASSSGPPTPG